MGRRLAALSVVLFVVGGLVPGLLAEDKAESKFFFKDKDRIVFLGDSITEQYQYSTDIELYLTTRFPQWRLEFINAGISGDTAGGGKGRFAAHVLAEKPTAVTINFGMNDGGYGALNPQARDNFAANTAAMLEAAKAAGVRVAVCSPNAVDRRIQERFKLYLETQKEFYAPLKEVAAKGGAEFVDQYAVTRASLERMEKDEAKQVVPFGDGFHTSSNGGLFMAHAILTGLHAPQLVSHLELNVLDKATKVEGCRVMNVEADPTGAEFIRTDDALPFPVQKDWVSLLPYVNHLKDLNWYGLKVTGLSEGKYMVTADGEEIGRYTSQELADGVNLGLATTGPIHAQGQKVFEAINAKNQIVHQRFRGVVMFNAPDWLADVANERKPAELAKRKALIDQKQAEIYELAHPMPHTFAIKAVK